MSRMGPIYPGDVASIIMSKGYAAGFAPKYKTSTSVDITAGVYEVDRTFFSLAAAHTHNMTSLGASFDLHYVYLNKSASLATPFAPVFYNTTSEPVLSVAKSGWYHPTNTEDRLILTLPAESSALYKFVSQGDGNSVKLSFQDQTFPWSALLMIPAGVFQAPTLNAMSALVPVNAKSVKIKLSDTNSGGPVSIYAGSEELCPASAPVSAAQMIEVGWDRRISTQWLVLGSSRNVNLAGSLATDNALSMLPLGYEFER